MAKLRISNFLRGSNSFLIQTRRNHVAIVGSGPSGFYSAKYLLEKNENIKVDLYEKLPVPYGLIRFGVAPDHQDVKAVMNTFRSIAENSRFRFYGNISVGSPGPNSVPIDLLLKNYSAVILATGAPSDSHLNIPNENLQGIIPARKFVNWYNGHPDSCQEDYDLSKVKRAIVIGQGNVALDIARVLTKSISAMEVTDISSRALLQLRQSSIEEVWVVGRRGPCQAAFTIKELRDLTKLPGVSVSLPPVDLQEGLTQASKEEAEANRPKKRILELMTNISNGTLPTPENPTTDQEKEMSSGKEREIVLRFLEKPIEFLPDPSDPSSVGSIILERCKLEGPPGQQKAVGTGQRESVPCELVLTSIGYRGLPLEGVPLSPSTHTFHHSQGRVLRISNEMRKEEEGKEPVPRLYTVGWAKRGPTGIVGTNITCAKETVQSVLEDLSKLEPSPEIRSTDPAELVLSELSEPIVNWTQALNIEKAEETRGQVATPSKLREKLLSREEMMNIITENMGPEITKN